MKKVIVIGCPGSGKSTFSRALRDITGLPLYYLDMIYHKPDKSVISKHEFNDKLRNIIKKDEWIIDGNYSRTMPIRLKRCDTVFWLDYPLEICLNSIESRVGKPREDMPWIETEKDEDFLNYVRNFNSTDRPKTISLLNDSKNKEIFAFHSRAEASAFLMKQKNL